ncbi:MAG TPA: hypothetical protein VMT18_09730 [Planctomycetota bacterium]|nr:hypothetical protein [Planctomycetota bacterium]
MASRRLYTETDVRALPRGAELVLGKSALATPAALDLAFERGLRVVWGEGDAGAPVGDALARLLAGDGTYVLVVRGGRAAVSRLTDAGPVPFGHLP